MRCCLLLIAVLIAPEMSRGESFVYVSLLNEKKIVCFGRNVENGNLIRLHEKDCPAEPAFLNSSSGPAAIDSNSTNRILFVAFRSTGELASYSVAGQTGRLKFLGAVPGGDDPAYLEPDRSGTYFAAAYYVSNQVTINKILPNGALSKRPTQTSPTASRAHGLAFTSDNRTLLVPHTGANRIYSFQFDAADGTLTAATPPFLKTPAPNEPRHIMLHPSDRWAYTSDEKGDSISVYKLTDSQLQLTQTVPTIPADFDGTKNSTARCVIAPDGRSIYVANRGHNSIASFAISQKNGRVTALGQTPTEAIPRSFTISPDGRFLYAAGQQSGRIAAYRILPGGGLQRIATYDCGPVSWAIHCVDCE